MNDFRWSQVRHTDVRAVRRHRITKRPHPQNTTNSPARNLGADYYVTPWQAFSEFWMYRWPWPFIAYKNNIFPWKVNWIESKMYLKSSQIKTKIRNETNTGLVIVQHAGVEATNNPLTNLHLHLNTIKTWTGKGEATFPAFCSLYNINNKCQ